MARPTHYSDEIVRRSKEYLDNYEAQGDVIPSVAGLAVFLGRSRTLLHDWAADDDKSEFKDILEQIGAKQEMVTLNNALAGNFNATIAKLLLGKHGYHEKVDNQLTGANNGAIQVQGWILEGVKPSDTSPST